MLDKNYKVLYYTKYRTNKFCKILYQNYSVLSMMNLNGGGAVKINRQKYEIARARACKGFKDIVDSGVPKGTLCRVVGGEDARPETVGKIANILGVDVTEIIEQKGE